MDVMVRVNDAGDNGVILCYDGTATIEYGLTGGARVDVLARILHGMTCPHGLPMSAYCRVCDEDVIR